MVVNSTSGRSTPGPPLPYRWVLGRPTHDLNVLLRHRQPSIFAPAEGRGHPMTSAGAGQALFSNLGLLSGRRRASREPLRATIGPVTASYATPHPAIRRSR